MAQVRPEFTFFLRPIYHGTLVLMTCKENSVKGGIRLLVDVWYCCSEAHPLQGAYLFKNGHFYNQKDIATLSIEEHYQRRH